MKRQKSVRMDIRTIKESLCIIVLLVLCIPQTVYADSSWMWFTKTAPYELLPFVAVLTIAIEYFMILKLLDIKKKKRLFAVICLANLLSFLLTYGATFYASGYENIMNFFDGLDFYTINFGYLFLTLIIECPVVYGVIADEVKNNKKSIGIIALANIVTTVLVIVIERISCKGKWM